MWLTCPKMASSEMNFKRYCAHEKENSARKRDLLFHLRKPRRHPPARRRRPRPERPLFQRPDPFPRRQPAVDAQPPAPDPAKGHPAVKRILRRRENPLFASLARGEPGFSEKGLAPDCSRSFRG